MDIMAELALIHLLKMSTLIVRLLLAAVELDAASRYIFVQSVEDTEEFLNNYIDVQGQKVNSFPLPKKTGKDYIH